MARYDKATIDFIEKVADAPSERHSNHSGEDFTKDVFKALRTAVKLKQKPAETLAKGLIGKGTSELLKESAVKALKLFEVLNDHFKTSWWDWEPETLWKSLPEVSSIKLTPETCNLVMALQVCVTTDAPFEQWHVFEKVAHAFSQNNVDFSVVQPLELTEAARAIKILKRLRPKEVFEKEICGYLASIAKHSGVVYLPPELFPEEANKLLLEMSYEKPLAAATEEAWQKKKAAAGDEDASRQLEILKEIKEFAANG